MTSIDPRVLFKIRNSPKLCGVYRYFDRDNTVLYIGKAKNLFNRLNNYLQKDLGSRISKMLCFAKDLDWIVCENEAIALLTEALQIKELQPRYNVLLKDDKSFMELVIVKEEECPKFFVRRVRNKGRRKCKTDTISLSNIRINSFKKKNIVSFGPFIGRSLLKNVTDVLQKVFLIRDCSDSVFGFHKKNKRPCLQYHLKRCSAPCAGLIDKKSYKINVRSGIAFCRGDKAKVLQEMFEQMNSAIDNANYQSAKIYRDKIRSLGDLGHDKLKNKDIEMDVIVMEANSKFGQFCVQLIRNNRDCGQIELPIQAMELDQDSIVNLIAQFYENKTPASCVVLNQHLDVIRLKLLSNALSLKADFKVIVKEAESDLELFWQDELLKKSKASLLRASLRQQSIIEIYQSIKAIFKLPSDLKRIEVFDNSHLQGSSAIGVKIVADKTGFIRSDYRKYRFNENLINQKDDYAMMFDMLLRRFNDIKFSEKIDLSLRRDSQVPDLIIVDGGKGQVRAAQMAMNRVGVEILIVGMAKGIDRNAGREVFYFPNGRQIRFDVNDEVLMYLQTLRDEAHRFAISSHRADRNKKIDSSLLSKIEGIGKKRRQILLSSFASIEKIAEATVEEIQQKCNFSKNIASKIYNYFNEI